MSRKSKIKAVRLNPERLDPNSNPYFEETPKEEQSMEVGCPYCRTSGWLYVSSSILSEEERKSSRWDNSTSPKGYFKIDCPKCQGTSYIPRGDLPLRIR